MERRVSEESVMSILRDFESQGPEDTPTINSMVSKAKRAIDTHAKDALLFKRIRVATLLRTLIDVAIDDRGKHYVAYTVLAYEKEKEPAVFLVELAQVWLTYLLYPGEYVSLHSIYSFLWRLQSKQTAIPKNAYHLPSKLHTFKKQHN
jgi:hypothetical protein